MEQQKLVTVKLVSLEPVVVNETRQVSGWGREAQEIAIDGKVAQIMVYQGGESKFGIRILENGDIILTSYHDLFIQTVERNLRLTNERPWKDVAPGNNVPD